MRTSTDTIYKAGAGSISTLQANLVRAQNLVSAGRKMLTPADDPVAAAAALEITQAQSVNQQYATNRQTAKSALELEESTMQTYTSLLQDVKTGIINAGNGSLDNVQRQFIATDLRGRFDELMSIANTRDSAGNYIFAGYQHTAQPFNNNSGTVTYSGDQGQRLLQVSSARQMALSDSGDTVFIKNRTGNGTFETAAAAGNTGAGIVSAGSVTNTGALTGHQYRIDFSVVGTATTYNVVDTTSSTTLSSGNAYVAGQSIAFDGLQFAVTGAPANGDQFTVTPSTDRSIFATMDSLITLLGSAVSGASGQAKLTNGLNTANANIANALDNLLTVRASVGSRLKEIDGLDNSGQDRDLQYAEALSSLQDLDYAKAITELTQQKMTLEAAQASFVKISGLSLFDYIR